MERDLWEGAVADLLRRSAVVQPSDLPGALNAVVRPFGADITIYLVDLEQRALRALPESGKPTPQPLPVDSSLAGRAFMTVTPLTAVTCGWWDSGRRSGRCWS